MYDDLLEKYGRQFNVDPALLGVFLKKESSGNRKAVGPETDYGRARGLMQIMPGNFKKLGVTDPEDPDQNIRAGAQLIAEGLDKYGDVEGAARYYYGGSNERLHGPKTQAYAKSIAARYMGSGEGEDTMRGGTSSKTDVDAILFGDSAPSDAQGAKGSQAPSSAVTDDNLGKSPNVDDVLFGDSVPPSAAPGSGKVVFEGTTNPVTKAQEDFYSAYHAAGKYDLNAPKGSVANPFGLGEDETLPAPGAYYVDRAGNLARVPGGKTEGTPLEVAGSVANVASDLFNPAKMISDRALGAPVSDPRAAAIENALTSGVLQGGKNEFSAAIQTIPDIAARKGTAGFKERLAALDAADAAEKARYPIASDVGRVAGALTSGALIPEVKAGGLLANIAGRGVQGAALGGAQGFLSTDGTTEDRIHGAEAGALLGGTAGVVLPGIYKFAKGIGGTVRDLIEPLSAPGREAIANRLIGKFGAEGPLSGDAGEIIPGSVPTLAQATANPGIATLERTVRLSRPTPFAERAAQNAEARDVVLSSLKGDENTVADLVNSRTAALRDAREAAFKGAGQADTDSVVKAVDAALEAPEAHMEEVARPLQALREKMVSPPPETTPEQTAAFNRSVARSFGADASALTPEVMSAAKGTLGKKFEEIAGKTQVQWDDALRNSVGQIIHDTAQVVPESQLPPLFKQLDNIASTANGGEISGASYQALTKKGSPLDSLMGASDPTIRNAASRIRDALDDALERSVKDKGLLDELRATRLQYKNLKTTEAALRSAGPDKQVTPQAILSAVKRNFGNYAYQGGGPLGDAAEAAVKEASARAPIVERDPRQLFGMRESISGAIDSLEKKGTDAAQAAADHLRGVRDQLDVAIDKAAPGYGSYVELSARSAEPVEAQKFLQSLRLTDMKGQMTLGRVDSALKRIDEMRAKPGKNAAKSITQDTLDQLRKIHADLLREANSGLGRPIGPDTAQHLATGNIANRMNIPLALGASAVMHNPIAGAAVGLGKAFYGLKNEQIMDALANRLLQPQALRDVTPAKAGIVSSAVKRGARSIPATAGTLSNQLTGTRSR